MAEKISRREFLKLIGVVGGAIMFAPLKFRKVFGTNENSTNTSDVPAADSNAGPDGVSFLYPTKPGGFVWYMNEDNPFDSHLEIGGGSTYKRLIKNKDGSWKPSSDGKVKFNILVTPGQKDAIGGCKMNFTDCIQRGYTSQPSITNVELTGFFNMSKKVTRDGIYMRGPWNHHPAPIVEYAAKRLVTMCKLSQMEHSSLLRTYTALCHTQRAFKL